MIRIPAPYPFRIGAASALTHSTALQYRLSAAVLAAIEMSSVGFGCDYSDNTRLECCGPPVLHGGIHYWQTTLHWEVDFAQRESGQGEPPRRLASRQSSGLNVVADLSFGFWKDRLAFASLATSALRPAITTVARFPIHGIYRIRSRIP